MRSPAAALLAGLFVELLALAASGPAGAQAAHGRLRPPPPPAAAEPAPDVTGAEVTGAPVASSPSTPGAGPARSPALRPALAPPPALRSAVRSRWARPATVARSTTAQCRVQCAVERQTCAGGGGDASGCDPGWTRCLSSCSGLAYRRGP